jgi:peptidyl-prolyl cis-trans isomerase B (cyclophilin B)
MQRNKREWRSLRKLGWLGLMVLFAVTGCTPQGQEPEKVEMAPTPNAKKEMTPPPANDRLHQSFLEAVSLDPPEGQLRPPDKTKAGKNVAKLYEKIAGRDGAGGLWDKIRFTSANKKTNYTAIIKTEIGDIRMEFLPEVAPNHVRNFLALATAGYYDGLEFDRTVYEELPAEKGKFFECLQAGCPLGSGEPGYGSIGYWLKPEMSENIKHEAGTVGAWHGEQVESAACKFYITLDQAPWMDGNYTVFGKVTQGLDVARKIRARPVRMDEKDRPERPVVINAVTIEPAIGGMGP